MTIQTAPVVPKPVYRSSTRTTRYIMVRNDGAVPLQYEWNALQEGALSVSQPSRQPAKLTKRIADQFHTMVRHGMKVSHMDGDKVELRIES